MLANNPEFRKHLKLEVNTTRLAVSLGLLLLISLLVAQDVNMNGVQEQIKEDFATVFRIFSTIGFFITILWGTYLAASSINEEVRQKTWDFVRMSSLSPAKILIGKLFGSTSLVWISTLAIILPATWLSGSFMIDGTAAVKRPEFITLLQVTVCAVLWAILSHAWGILMALQAMSTAGAEKSKTNSFGIALVILLAGSFIGTSIQIGFSNFTQDFPKPHLQPQWYGISMQTLDMVLLCLSFATFWTIAGAYQTLRQTLKFRDLPLPWIAFLLTTTAFLQGFQVDMDFADLLLWPMALSVITMGVMLMGEARDIVAYKTFAARFTSGDYLNAARHLPLWMISAVYLLISIVLSLLLLDHSLVTTLGMLSLVMFITRDVLALHYIAWKPGVRRPILGFIVYGFVMYFLLPLLFKEFDIKLAGLFFPGVGAIKQHLDPDTLYNVSYWLLLTLQIAGAAWLFRGRWQVAFKQERSV